MSANKARSFVTIMVVIASFALIARIAVDNILKMTIVQNESDAQATLKLISTAFENYAKDHIGAYPVNFSILTESAPQYLDRDYVRDSPLKGYDYSCPRSDGAGFSCIAEPLVCNFTGSKVFTVTQGGLTVDQCVKRE